MAHWLWWSSVAAAADPAPAAFAEIATFGDPRFAHPAVIRSATLGNADGRLRVLAADGLWSWPVDGVRAGRAPLVGCDAAVAARFDEAGLRVAVQCEDPAGSGVFGIAGQRLQTATLALDGAPATFCGDGVWMADGDALVRVDAHTGARRAAGPRPVALTCVQGRTIAAFPGRLSVGPGDPGEVSLTLDAVALGPAEGSRFAAVLRSGAELTLATIATDDGSVARGPRLEAIPSAIAEAEGRWAALTGGRLAVVDAEGAVLWSVDADGLADGVQDLGGLWVLHGLRLDPFDWAGASPTARATNRAGPFSGPSGPTRRDTWFGPDGALYSRFDADVVRLDPTDGAAVPVARVAPGAGGVSKVRGGAIVAPAGDGVHLLSELAGDQVLRPPDGSVARRTIAPDDADAVAALGEGDKGWEGWIWRRLEAGTRPGERAKLPGTPRFARWSPGARSLWIGTDAGMTEIRNGRAKDHDLRAEWLVPVDVGFAGRSARWLVAAEVSRPRADGPPEVKLGATPTLRVLAPSGREVAERKLGWKETAIHGFVPGTLEVWSVTVADGDTAPLVVFDPDLEQEVGRVTVPVHPDGTVHLLWSADGGQLATEAADGRITLWQRAWATRSSSGR